MSKNLVVINTGDEKIQLTNEDVVKYFVKGSNITEQEVLLFMNLCRYRKLNPWTNDAYLIKYGKTAQMIISKDVFIETANKSEKCEGWNAGITVIYRNKDGEIQEKNKKGTIVLENEKLVGGWIEIYIKGQKNHETTVSLKEYYKPSSNSGTKTTWETMPGTMIRKVAIVAGLREYFSKELGNMYIKEEIIEQEITKDTKKDEVNGNNIDFD